MISAIRFRPSPLRRYDVRSAWGRLPAKAYHQSDVPRFSLRKGRLPLPRPIGLGLLLGMAFLLAAVSCGALDDVPPMELRAQKLNKEIMCPVCPGESIDQSRNPLALQMRDVVGEKFELGWTEAEIKEFFVERYGPSVVMEPPRSGISLAAWVLPPVAVAGAVLALFLVLRVMRRSPVARTEPVPEGARLSDGQVAYYFERIDRILDNAQEIAGQELKDKDSGSGLEDKG